MAGEGAEPWACITSSSIPALRGRKEQAEGESGGQTEELCGGSDNPGRFTWPGGFSVY